MAIFISDGKKLLDVEYDEVPNMHDIVDEMRVISKDESIYNNETALFLLEPNGDVTCYVLDEIYIIGHVGSFHNLTEALKAWHNHEI